MPLPLLAGRLFEADLAGIPIENASSTTQNLYREDTAFLLVEGTFEQRKVAAARREVERVIVTEGLEQGELLLTD